MAIHLRKKKMDTYMSSCLKRPWSTWLTMKTSKLLVCFTKNPCVECDFCGDVPCVWLVERGHIIIGNDAMEHSHTVTVFNRTRHRIAFHYMFCILNGVLGQKGIRKKQPECVENNGIRALFPDLNYMGFKEE
jgi:hypothetical protein